MAIGTPTERYAVQLTAQGATSVFSPATTVAAGSVALILGGSNTASKVPSSIADSVGNTWVVDATSVLGGGTINLYVARCHVATQITSSDTITITWSSATAANCQIWVQEVTGLVTSSAFDKTAQATGTSTTPSSGNTATLSQADEIVWGMARGPGNTWTKGASYSNATTPTLGATLTTLEYKIVAATTAVAADGTWGTSCTWDALVTTYKGATAGAASLIYQPGLHAAIPESLYAR